MWWTTIKWSGSECMLQACVKVKRSHAYDQHDAILFVFTLPLTLYRICQSFIKCVASYMHQQVELTLYTNTFKKKEVHFVGRHYTLKLHRTEYTIWINGIAIASSIWCLRKMSLNASLAAYRTVMMCPCMYSSRRVSICIWFWLKFRFYSLMLISNWKYYTRKKT